MICPNCGEPNPDVAKFCGKCGATMAVATPPPSTGQQMGGPIPAGPTGVSNEMRIGIAIASVIIPLVGIIMGAIYLKDPDPEKKAAGRLWLWIGIGMGVFYCLLTLSMGA